MSRCRRRCATQRLLDFRVSCPECCWFGALPATQPLDIVHRCALVVENGLDLRGAGCAAQLDIKAYYDILFAVLCMWWLLDRGCDRALCAAVLRHQLLPRICVEATGGTGLIPRCGTGTLTGSRTAGALGRIPVLDAFIERHAVWQALGFRVAEGLGCPRAVLCTTAHADNVYAARPTPGCAAAILDDFASVQHTRWGLNIKTGSRNMVSARGARGDVPVGWSACLTMSILGHVVSANGSTAACVQNTLQSAWRARLAHCRRCPRFVRCCAAFSFGAMCVCVARHRLPGATMATLCSHRQKG